MPIHIAEIPFLNCAPFYWNKSQLPSDIEWVELNPKEIGMSIRAGKIDGGPVSLVDSFEFSEQFEPLLDLGIAVKASAMSVLLLMNGYVEQMETCTIGLTQQSVTSVELLKIIMAEKYGLAPTYHLGFEESDDGRLYIGDEALKARGDKNILRQYPNIIDLGDEWFRWQKRPFVFARWIVRKELDQKKKDELGKILLRNLNACAKNLGPCIDWFKKTRGWNYENAQNYLEAFNYRFDDKENASIVVFEGLLKKSRNSVRG